MRSRPLRVSYRCPASQSRASMRLHSSMPFQHLQSRGLDRAGFAIGADVQLRIEHGRLMLEVLDPQVKIA